MISTPSLPSEHEDSVFNPPQGFVQKEKLESSPEAWLVATGVYVEMGGEHPLVKEVRSYEDMEELRVVGQYFKELFTENITPEDILALKQELLDTPLEEIVENELYPSSGQPNTRGRILLAATETSIREYLTSRPEIMEKFIAACGKDLNDLDAVFSPDKLGATPERLISLLSSLLKENEAESESFKKILIQKAFEEDLLVNFIAGTRGSRYFTRREEGKPLLVIKFTPASGADETRNILYARYLDEETGQVLQATVKPKAYGKGFDGMRTDAHAAGYIPDISYQREVKDVKGNFIFEEIRGEELQKLQSEKLFPALAETIQ